MPRIQCKSSEPILQPLLAGEFPLRAALHHRVLYPEDAHEDKVRVGPMGLRGVTREMPPTLVDAWHVRGWDDNSAVDLIMLGVA